MQVTSTVVDVTGDRSKVQCCTEQYCIGIWNVRSMNKGKLKVVKRDDESERRHSRNWRTKMDWKGVNLPQTTILSATMGRNTLEDIE